MSHLTGKDIKNLAKLAHLTISKKEETLLKSQLEDSLKLIDEFEVLNTSSTPQTYIVTGTKNVFREDVIDKNNLLSQADALSNAKRVYKGYFVVNAILNEN